MIPALSGAQANRERTHEPAPATPLPPLFTRWLLLAAVSAAAGLGLVADAYALARGNEGLGAARALYWLGLAAIVGPLAARMLMDRCPRPERVALLVLGAIALYAVKALHDVHGFTFSDELIHLANARNMQATGALYGASPLLPITSQFPGVDAGAVVVSELSGLGLVHSALLLVGAARIVLALALFLLCERLTGDSRLAGVAVLLYAATPNFLYWSAQFSYESLTLPLFVVVLWIVVAREADDASRGALAGLAAVLIVAIAVTHHLSSYALVALLWALVLVARLRRQRAPVGLAAFATVVAVGWLFAVAEGTRTYLGSIFERAGRSVTDAFTGGVTRAPFESSAAGASGTPWDERILGLAAVLLVVAMTAAGLRRARRFPFPHGLGPVLALGAVFAVISYGLRVVPGAWEVANRSSDFIFIGVGLVAALALVRWLRDGGGRVALGALAVVVVVAGSSVIGWPSAARLPRAQVVAVGATTIEPQGSAVADWAAQHLPRDASIVADETSGRMLALQGFTNLYAGREPGVSDLLSDPTLPGWQREFLRRQRVEYVVLDRRRASADNTTGYFFPRPAERDTFYSTDVRGKFAPLPGTARVYDSGDVVVYALGGRDAAAS